MGQGQKRASADNPPPTAPPNDLQAEAMLEPTYYSAGRDELLAGGDLSYQPGYSLLDEWNTTDWLELDSSAFGPYMDIDPSSLQWMPNMEM